MEKYPKLFNDIITHERKHSSGWNIGDLKMDMRNSAVRNNRKDYYKFIASNPTALSQFIPIYRRDGKWIIDPALALTWIVALFFTVLISVKII